MDCQLARWANGRRQGTLKQAASIFLTWDTTIRTSCESKLSFSFWTEFDFYGHGNTSVPLYYPTATRSKSIVALTLSPQRALHRQHSIRGAEVRRALLRR